MIWWSVRSDQSLSRVRVFETPWIAACQASLSITNSQSSLRLMSIESVMPSSHLILCHPLLLLPPIPPSIRVFSNESTLFAWGGQSTGVSALASFPPKKSQGWSPSEWTGYDHHTLLNATLGWSLEWLTPLVFLTAWMIPMDKAIYRPYLTYGQLKELQAGFSLSPARSVHN